LYDETASSIILSMPDAFTQTVDIETPELVVVSYTIAGLGSRVYAALIDLVICIAAMLALVIGGAMLSPGGSHSRASLRAGASTAWAFAVLTLFQFAILWGYYLLFEGLRDGQTIGKKLMRLRAVRDGGYSIGFAASAVRNLMRIVDLQPAFTYAVGITSVLVSKSGKRLGDLVAGTIVVRESMIARSIPVPTSTSSPIRTALTTRLNDDELALLERWVERRSALEPERRRELTTQVAAKLRHALGESTTTSDAALLLALVAAERAARAGGAAARDATGASRERYAIVATSSPRWIAFASTLATAQRGGLKSLGEDGVRTFVAEYRALAADLARLRTAVQSTGSDELFYLGRLVASAHNLVYRDRRKTWRQILRFIAIDVPTEVRRSAVPITLAAAFMFIPAAIAYTAVVRHPDVAQTFIPIQMLDRAQDGVNRARNGDGYIADPQVFRPLMASGIIANNVQVTIAVFAMGITAGIGTLLLLLFNGMSLGGVLGLYASKNILWLIVAFVAPHGVLELSAICIAGGGGLLIAAALLLPGKRTRVRALAENSRRAMYLMACSTLLLIVAGTLEGMVSPIPYWPISLKLIVSATTLVLLVAYLRGGAGAGSKQTARLDLEVPVDERGGHLRGADIEHGDSSVAHASQRFLALSDELLGRRAAK
jgi:uncharacterized membrane protein SpoIIM required for sporulation/uncharacterized RDD family membrane protein YckC